MYGRELNGETLAFGHAGILYRRSFVMYDRGSESLWLHVTGEALKGPMKGQRLEFLPSEIVPWGDWLERYPGTLVLGGERVEGFMSSFSLREEFEEYGLSVGEGRGVTLFAYAALEAEPVRNDRVDGEPMVIVFDPETSFAAAYASQVDDELLHFEIVDAAGLARAKPEIELGAPGKYMRDTESGSIWDRSLGTCVAGAKRGSSLAQLPSTPFLVDRWTEFFPEGRVVN